ncbi:MAG: DUF4352 domain-containing protein [archaeon]
MKKVLLIGSVLLILFFSGCTQQNQCEVDNDCKIDDSPCVNYLCESGKCFSIAVNNGANCGEEKECFMGECVKKECDVFECDQKDKFDCNGTTKETYNYSCINEECTYELEIDENSFDCGYIVPCIEEDCNSNNTEKCEGTTKITETFYCDQKEGCTKKTKEDTNSADCGYKALNEPRELGESIIQDNEKVTIFSATKKDSYNWAEKNYTKFAENGKTFLFLDIEIENVGSSSYYACPWLDTTITDGRGNSYDTSSHLGIGSFDCATLTPNTKKRGTIYAEILKSATELTAVYEFSSYNDIYGYWTIDKTKSENNSQINCNSYEIIKNGKCVDCGGEEQPCCADGCDYGKECFNGICKSCGGNGELACPSEGCDYGYEIIGGACVKKCGSYEIRQNGICTECGGANQIPCTSGCDYGYELLNGVCVEKCGLYEIRQNGICVSCGSANQIPCSNGCRFGYELSGGMCIESCGLFEIRQNGICVECGDWDQPCCEDNSCLFAYGASCVNGVCQDKGCGEFGESCCEGNTCNDSDLYCHNNLCLFKS